MMYKVSKLFVLSLVFFFSVSYISPSAVMAGTLEFDGVPVDITTVDGEDLLLVPGTGGNIQIGDAAGTNSNATSNDDLHITGVLETDGAAYLDGGMVAGSNVIPSLDDTHNLGSSSKFWKNLYVSNIFAGDIAEIKDIAYSFPAAQGGADTFLKNDGAGNLTWAAAVGGGASLPVADSTSIAEGSADATKEVRFEVDGLTSGATRVLTIPDANGTIAVSATVPLALSAAGDLSLGTVPLNLGGTGASLADPAANRLLGWDDTDNAVKMMVIGSGLSYDQATDTLSASGAGDASTNTATSVDSEVTLFSGTTGKLLKRASATGIASLSSGVLSTVAAPSGTLVGTSDSQTLTNKTLDDATTSVVDDGDVNKIMKFQLSGITTGNTRTLTVPDASGTLAVSATAPVTLSAAGAVGVTDASGVASGVVNTAAQTFAGAKTFSGGVVSSTVSTAAGNVTLQPAGSGTTAHVVIGAANGGAGSATPDFLVLDKSSGASPAGVEGAILVDSAGKFNIFEGGAWKVLCNSTDQGCGTGSGSALSAITNATGANSISAGNNAQAWNWALTTAAKTGMAFSESAASTNGAGSQFILEAGTASGSTAGPLKISSQSADVGDIIFDLASAGDFLIQDGGATFASFNDDGSTSLNSLTIGSLDGILKASSGAVSAAAAGTDYYAPGGTDIPLADGGTGASLADPAANRLLGWDDTDNAVRMMVIGSGLSYDQATDTLSASGSGGDASTNTSTSVDSEVTLFSGTTGKLLKRATGSGVATLTSGVLGTVTAPSGTIVGTSDSQTLTNKTLSDSTTLVVDNADVSKTLKFDVANSVNADGILQTTFTTDKTIVFPDTAGTVYVSSGTDVSLADGGTGASLADPAANRLLGWDDTDNAVKMMALGTGLSYDAGTDTLSATGTGDVSSAANLTDNAVVRGDGGAKGVQTSGIVIDDTNNVSGAASLTSPLVYGSSAADGDITIEGTSDSTKTTSYVNLQPNGGNVGIGTSTPYDQLVLYKSSNAGSTMTIATPGTQNAQQAAFSFISKDNAAVLGAAGTKGWQLLARGDAWTTASQQNDMFFSYYNGTTWVDPLVIDSATANIGIGGNTDPSTKLDISGGLTLREIADPGVGALNEGRIYFDATANKFKVSENGAAFTDLVVSGGAASASASYITKTPDASLSQEFALNSLATGLLQVTTTTGDLTSITTSAGVGGLISDETGAGGVLVFNNSPSITTPIIKGEAVVALTDAATIATDASLGNIFTVSSAVNRILGIPSNPTTGQKCIWRWKNTDSVAHTLTLTTAGAGAFRFGTTVQGTSATPAGKTDYIGAIYNATDNRWDVIAYAKGYN